MKTLESLVPPWELCKQIPEECFADSAMVWRLENSTFPDKPEYYHVYLRGTGESMLHVFPAPTLAEIMPECGNLFYTWNGGKGWEVFCDANSKVLRNYDPNLTTAALKLWLLLVGWKETK